MPKDETSADKDRHVERAQLIRAHEANCKIEHPTEEEQRFRVAVMRQLGVSFGLKSMRNVQVG